MKSHIIIPIVVLLVVVGGVGALYYFYFAPQLKEYTEARQLQGKLIQKVQQLEKDFSATRPDIIVEAWSSRVVPYRDAVEVRSRFFSLGEDVEPDPIPEEAIPRVYYVTKQRELIVALQQEAFQRAIRIPNTTFKTPQESDLQGVKVTHQEAEDWLRTIRYGASVVRMLMDANVLAIESLEFHQKRNAGDVVDVYPVGAVVYMYLKDLAAFLNEGIQKDRFFTVEAIKVSNSMLAAYTDPPLRVELIFTQGKWHELTPEEKAAEAAKSTQETRSASPFKMFRRRDKSEM